MILPLEICVRIFYNNNQKGYQEAPCSLQLLVWKARDLQEGSGLWNSLSYHIEKPMRLEGNLQMCLLRIMGKIAACAAVLAVTIIQLLLEFLFRRTSFVFNLLLPFSLWEPW